MTNTNNSERDVASEIRLGEDSAQLPEWTQRP